MPGAPVTAAVIGLVAVALFLVDPHGGVYTTTKLVGSKDEVKRLQPESILTSSFNNPSFGTSNPNWASDLVSGKTYPRDCPNEWVQVLHPGTDYPGGDYDIDLVGLSGWAIHPELSGSDVWFSHPFGKDWEFYVAPDPQYASLLAASNKVSNDSYFQTARNDAANLGLSVPGVLGVEMEQPLIPEQYRAQEGDRVAVFGRWIVDAGHNDFHSEIHPPLLLVTARVPQKDMTTTRIISRPYLVAQTYEGDGKTFFEHMKSEVEKVEIVVLSSQLEARPKFTPKPFSGNHLITFTVKPPTPPESPLDRLMVSFHFTVRHGVTVQVTGDSGSVLVAIQMNEAAYIPASLPTKHDISISLAEIRNSDATANTDIKWADFLNALFDLYALTIENLGGVATDSYEPPQASSVHDSEITKVWASDLPVNTPFSIDDNQPYPIYGFLNVEWEKPQVVTSA